jgi:nucleoid DNA-binding protein
MAKAAKPAGKKPAGKKAMTKSQFVAHLAEKAELSKKQIDVILNEIVEVVKGQVSSKGPGKFVFPGLARFTLKHKPAVQGGVTKTNPLNGKTYVTQDKPAKNVVRARPVKALQESMN